jgi:hypothetical protein
LTIDPHHKCRIGRWYDDCILIIFVVNKKLEFSIPFFIKKRVGSRDTIVVDVFDVRFTHSRYWYRRIRYLPIFEIGKSVVVVAFFVLAGLSKALAVVIVAFDWCWIGVGFSPFSLLPGYSTRIPYCTFAGKVRKRYNFFLSVGIVLRRNQTNAIVVLVLVPEAIAIAILLAILRFLVID